MPENSVAELHSVHVGVWVDMVVLAAAFLLEFEPDTTLFELQSSVKGFVGL